MENGPQWAVQHTPMGSRDLDHPPHNPESSLSILTAFALPLTSLLSVLSNEMHESRSELERALHLRLRASWGRP